MGPLGNSGRSSVNLVWTDQSGNFASSTTAAPVVGQSYQSVLTNNPPAITGLVHGRIGKFQVQVFPTAVYAPIPQAAGTPLTANIQISIAEGTVFGRYTTAAYANPLPYDAFPLAMFGPLPNVDASGLSVLLNRTSNGAHTKSYIVSGHMLAPPGPQQLLYKVNGLSSASIQVTP
jgi:hypothetical protein